MKFIFVYIKKYILNNQTSFVSIVSRSASPCVDDDAVGGESSPLLSKVNFFRTFDNSISTAKYKFLYNNIY